MTRSCPPDQHHQGHQVQQEGGAEEQEAPDVLQLSEAGVHAGVHDEVVVVQREERCVMSARSGRTDDTQAVQSVQCGGELSAELVTS